MGRDAAALCEIERRISATSIRFTRGEITRDVYERNFTCSSEFYAGEWFKTRVIDHSVGFVSFLIEKKKKKKKETANFLVILSDSSIKFDKIRYLVVYLSKITSVAKLFGNEDCE